MAKASADRLFTAFIDGASRGNPGEAAYGVRICDESGAEVDAFGRYIGRQTNNYAEYRALLAALEWAAERGLRRLRVRSDSELLVRQLQGAYRVKSPRLRPLYEEARARIEGLAEFRVEHVKREANEAADRLANEALDDRASS